MVRVGWCGVRGGELEYIESASLDSRNGRMEKRTINTLIMRWDVLCLIACI